MVWHAVEQEVDAATGAAQVARIAASFRIVRDPVDWFAAMREAPHREAERRAGRLARVQAMLAREGHRDLVSGKPVLLRNGVYLEWMAHPEPRFQLLLPVGRALAGAPGAVLDRPRPAVNLGDSSGHAMVGSLGWREFADGQWQTSNRDNAYLPMPGVGALLAARQNDPAHVYFHYSATVRVEEESDERRLNSLGWFVDELPELQRRWRAGELLSPGKPEKD